MLFGDLHHSGNCPIPKARSSEIRLTAVININASRVKYWLRYETTPSSMVDASRSRSSNMLTDLPSCEHDFTITLTVAQMDIR